MTDLLLSVGKFNYPQWQDAELLSQLDQTCKGHLVFKRSPAAKTYISHQYLEHPFHITRPFYLDNAYPELATLYLQSSSGGIVQGDWLQFKIEVEPGAAAQVTTQAGTKVHSMERGFALQKIDLELTSGAYLEYVPEPLILFPHSRLISSTAIRIAADASLIFSDAFVSHSADDTSFDLFANELMIMQGDNLLVLDRSCINQLHLNKASSTLTTYKAQGTVWLVSQALSATDLVSLLRDRITDPVNSYIGISTLPNHSGVWIRILAADAYTLRTSLNIAWAACREALINIPWPKRRK